MSTLEDKYHEAQRAYDNESPPSSCEDEGHVWRLAGTAEDGTQFYRCRRCGRESD